MKPNWSKYDEGTKEISLSHSDITTLDGIERFKELEYLSIIHTNVSDLSPLEHLKDLNELQIDNTIVSDISPLKGLKKLSEISLSYTNVSDLSPLNDHKLDYLWVYNTPLAIHWIAKTSGRIWCYSFPFKGTVYHQTNDFFGDTISTVEYIKKHYSDNSEFENQVLEIHNKLCK